MQIWMARVGNTSTTVQGPSVKDCIFFYMHIHMQEGRTRAEIGAGNATWLSTNRGMKLEKLILPIKIKLNINEDNIFLFLSTPMCKQEIRKCSTAK